jgi:Cys-tRNA(Pro)/Cys-tRNA(Cys) deacylase
MSKTTPATLSLIKANIEFGLKAYDYDPKAQHIGLYAAEALGLDAAQTFKTLMVELDTQAVCVVVPSTGEVSFKKLCGHLKAKSARMMKVADAERTTGYKVGGISPFAQRKSVTTLIDESAQLFDFIYINAGQRGLLLSINPEDARLCLKAECVDLMA